MRTILVIAAVFLMVSCGPSSKKSDQHQETNSNEAQVTESYALAYNVFVPDSLNENNYEIFSIALDGSRQTRLTNNPDVAWTYLAVDDKILFISDRDSCYRCFFLYEMNADGTEKKKITDFNLKDSWMSSRKNGQELIVTPSKDSVFYIINRQGQILNKVPTGKAYFNDPCFSPDGNQIVFRGAEKKFKKDSGYIDELYIMNSDGNELRQLTYYPKNDSTAKWYNYHAGPPRWHPTENFISYQSRQNGKSSLFAITPDGKKQWKLTNLEDNEGWHDWSDDGRYLAMETFDTDQKQFHITLMDWELQEHRVLTNTVYKYQQAPVFVRKPKVPVQ